ncbi:unnamed protein product [Blepharisma stoltei]|uniref:BTB domain-containing protein n=1 Tax=Blepharisma stoltei TaxID=1481888 RepID=A0AAU9JY04_9CILI|nr:unnamed protein product [Blepharisma stoltei]
MSQIEVSNLVCFVVENELLKIHKDTLLKKPYFQEILTGSETYPEVRIYLPDWMSSAAFHLYLSYIESSKLPKTDSQTARKLLWTADFFQDEELQKSLIVDCIIPHLTKDSVLLFLQDAFTKLSNSKSECWFELYHSCLLFIAENSHYIFSQFQSVIEGMDHKLIEDVMRYSMGRTLRISNTDNSFILEKIKALHNATGFVNLLEIEEKRITENFDCEIPIFEWEISDFTSGNFYKESKTFMIGESEWVLCIWSFEHENRCEISIKYVQSGEIFSKDCIVTLSLLIQTEDEKIQLKPKLVPLLLDSKTQSIIRSISPFSPQETSMMKLRLFGKIEYLYSVLLQHIARNPDISLEAEDLRLLPRDKLEAMLSYKYLNVNSEDQVLNIIGKWCEQHPYHISDEDAYHLLSCVKWEFVSLRSLLKSVKHFPSLKKSKVFQERFRREIEAKSKSKKSQNKEALPRKSYKHLEKEQFSSLKEYILSLSDIILENDGLSNSNSLEKDYTIQQLTSELKRKESEIKELRDKMSPSRLSRSAVLTAPNYNSPGLDKDEESESNLFVTPKSKTVKMHTSMDSSSTISTDNLFKSRRSGQALTSLIAKLQSRSPRSS